MAEHRPRANFRRAGFGGNYLYVDECNDLVVVLRWVPDLAGVIAKVLDTMENANVCAEAT